MKTSFPLLLLLLLIGFTAHSQQTVTGIVQSASNDRILENVNIVNLNQVKGATTNEKGEFEIRAEVNDTLYFSYIGYKSIQVTVSNDWLKYGDVKVKMTEVGIALEEVTVRPVQLTGYIEIDAKNIPIYSVHSIFYKTTIVILFLVLILAMKVETDSLVL